MVLHSDGTTNYWFLNIILVPQKKKNTIQIMLKALKNKLKLFILLVLIRPSKLLNLR